MDIEPRFEHFCRICTVEQEVGIMIFGEEGEKMMLPEKITQYLHVEVSQLCISVFMKRILLESDQIRDIMIV